MSDASQWFAQAAAAMRSVLEEVGGVIVIPRSEMLALLQEEDPRLPDCPEQRLRGLAIAMSRRQQIRSVLYDPACLKVLMVFDRRRFTPEEARQHARVDTAYKALIKDALAEAVA